MGLLLLAVLALLLPRLIGFIPSSDEINTVFVRNATFANKDFKVAHAEIPGEQVDQEKEVFPVYMHRIAEGSGTIIAYRWFNEGSRGALDDEIYAKLTVYLPSVEVGRYEFSKSPGLRGYYSREASAWRRSGCGGEIERGYIEILQVEKSVIKADVHTDVHCQRSHEMPSDEIEIDFQYSFTELSFEKVTPWIGKQGGHYYSESYPR